MNTRHQTRLQSSGISAKVLMNDIAKSYGDRNCVAITCSHLGRSTRLHAEVCRYISRSMMDARQFRRVVLVAADSAIEPWATRAADLFSVPVILVKVCHTAGPVEDSTKRAVIRIESSEELCRDAVVIAMADRVDCVYVRPKGTINESLSNRLDQINDATVRVAVHNKSVDRSSQRAAQSLMGNGAVGWYCHTSNIIADPNPRPDHYGSHLSSDDWADVDDQWLVHCTRSCSGPWPGQTERQHQDELLLSAESPGTIRSRSAIDTLRRITRMKRLVASAIASDRRWPVVCFSSVALNTLIARRQYRSHLHRWDYEPYGIAIRKSAAIRAGFKPVIYSDAAKKHELPKTDQFRFQSIGTTYDWTKESEWRHLGDVDLQNFDADDVRVFVDAESDLAGLSTSFPTSVLGPRPAQLENRSLSNAKTEPTLPTKQ